MEIDEQLISRWEAEQKELRKRVKVAEGSNFKISENQEVELLVGGLDITYAELEDGTPLSVVCCVVMRIPKNPQAGPTTELVEIIESREQLPPYVPGLLAFREVPLYRQILQRIRESNRPELFPQVLLVDGFGVLHPRRCGSASHLGVLEGIPTIGVAKHLLHISDDFPSEREIRDRLKPGEESADMIQIGPARCIELRCNSEAEPLGLAAVPSPDFVRPIYISAGHLISLDEAARITLRLCGVQGRHPEPLRLADYHSREHVRKQYGTTKFGKVQR